MLDNIYNELSGVLEKYKDPITDKYIKYDDSNINVIIKNRHVNVTINIDPSQTNKYDKLIKDLKKDLQNMKNVLSANVILTAEKKPGENNKNVSTAGMEVRKGHVITFWDTMRPICIAKSFLRTIWWSVQSPMWNSLH